MSVVGQKSSILIKCVCIKYYRHDLVNIDEFLPNIDYLCQNSQNTCQKNPGMSFSEK